MKRSPWFNGQEEVSFSLNRMSDLFHKIACKLHEHGPKSQTIITDFHLMPNVMARLFVAVSNKIYILSSISHSSSIFPTLHAKL